jgi:hypothetical protein
MIYVPPAQEATSALHFCCNLNALTNRRRRLLLHQSDHPESHRNAANMPQISIGLAVHSASSPGHSLRQRYLRRDGISAALAGTSARVEDRLIEK